jgi:hypothetical protein
MEIKMTLSKEQILAIKKALDLYSRVLCGQVEEVTRVIERTDFSRNYTTEQRKQTKIGVDLIKRAMFSEIYPATYGISSEGKLTQKAAIAYDIYQVIEKFAVEHILNAGTVIKSDVFKTAKEDLPIITLN